MEEFDVYDINGNKTGRKVRRGIDKLQEGEYHYVSTVIYVNDKDEILMQKRSADKRQYPGFFGLTGGAVTAGESIEEGCIRECREEIGIVPDLGKAVRIKSVAGHTVIFSFIIRQNLDLSKLVLQKCEVAEVMWKSPAQVREIIAEKKIMPKMVESVEVCLQLLENGKI